MTADFHSSATTSFFGGSAQIANDHPSRIVADPDKPLTGACTGAYMTRKIYI